MKAKRILISQPQPTDIEKSPYKKLIAKYHADITFFKFFDIVGVSATDFRRSRIHLHEHTAVIFNSKNSVDHFFRLAKELRVVIPETMKYFCVTEAVALYLQNYIQYRKRKIFFGVQSFSDLLEIMERHRDEQFIYPCSDEKQTDYIRQLDRAKFKYTKAVMYTLVPRDLTQFKLSNFDIIALFSPIGVRSLVQSFPDVKDQNLTIAAFGTSTHAALANAGIKLTIAAPTKSSPSMVMAIENYLLGKEQDEVIVPKTVSQKKPAAVAGKMVTPATKKPKSVIADKTKYKQLQEERKAKAAARRAERAAAKESARLEDVQPAKD